MLVVVEDLLCRVAMVYVPVEDQDALHLEPLLQLTRRHRDGIEETETPGGEKGRVSGLVIKHVLLFKMT